MWKRSFLKEPFLKMNRGYRLIVLSPKVDDLCNLCTLKRFDDKALLVDVTTTMRPKT